MSQTPIGEGGREAVEPCHILNVLEDEGYLTPTNRLVIERFMRTWRLSALQALLETHALTETQLADALASILRISRLFHLTSKKLALETLAVLPFLKAREWEAIVLKGDSGHLDLVIADPTRTDRINEIKQGLNCEITLSVTERSDIVRAIDELYPLSAQLPSLHGE